MTLSNLWKDSKPNKVEKVKSTRREWTEKEEQFLVENYKSLRVKGVSEALNRSVKSIEARANKLRERGYTIEIQPQWSKEDTEFLKANYTKLCNKTIASQLGKTYPSVQSKLSYMGLRRNRSELV